MWLGAKAGTLRMCVDATIDIWEPTVGHAWVEFTDNNGSKTTFGAWPKNGGTNQGTVVRANEEVAEKCEATASTIEVEVTYAELEAILRHNKNVKDDWTLLTQNCVHYASSVWHIVSGETVNISMSTPWSLDSWIKNHR